MNCLAALILGALIITAFRELGDSIKISAGYVKKKGEGFLADDYWEKK